MPSPQIIELTDRVVDLARHQIERGGDRIGLTPLEAGLLGCLAETPGQTVTRQELLQRVWGYRPGVETRAVDKTVARLRAKVNAEGPDYLVNVRGIGYRLDGIVSVSAAAGSSPSRNTNLEAWDPASFVGRSEEGPLRELLLRRDTRVVSLLGPGGIGKTRLARRVGAAVLGAFGGGVWFVDLTEVRSADGILAAIGQALGVAAAADPERSVAGAILARGPTLLILDNAEQIASEVAALLGRWTRALRDARFLVTTRERLRIAGETCLELEPLAESEAISLFIERAAEAGAEIAPSDHPHLRHIVAHLDRMPLAVELAAARVRLFGVAELSTRILTDLSVLRAGRRDATAREATLVGAITWSWDLLSEEERAVLVQAALFPDGFGLEAAEAVFDTTGDPLGLVEALVDKSMVRSTRDPLGRRRFRLYESIRAFAASREPLFRRGAELRLARFVAGEAERLATSFRAAVLEFENVLTGFEIARSAEPALAVRIALALQPVLAAVGPVDRAEAVLSEAIRLADPVLRARALLARGATRSSLARLDLARVDLEAALVAASEPATTAAIHSELGHLSRLQARTREAFEHYQAAMAGPPLEALPAAVLRRRLGRLCANVGRLEEADTHLAQALTLARGLGNARLESDVLLDLGHVAEARLDFSTAIDLEEEALALSRLAGDPLGEATARMCVGTARMHSGAFADAVSVLDDAALGLAVIGDRRAQSIARCHQGICLLALGDPEAALGAIRTALDLLEGVGDEVNVGVVETNLAEAYHFRGEFDAAKETLERALARLRLGGIDALVGAALGQLAAIEADRDCLARAEELLAEAEERLGDERKGWASEALVFRRLHVELARGTPGPGLDAVRAAIADGPPIGLGISALLAQRLLASAWTRRGRPALT